MKQTVIGIDFGNSNVKIVKKDEGIILNQPNLLGLKKNNENYACRYIGDSAKNMLGKTDDSVIIFSPINAGEIVNLDYAIIELKYFFKKLKIKTNFLNRLKIVMSIPTAINDEQKEKYYAMCKALKAKEIALVPQIMCCAIGEKINISANNARLYVNIGGGTVDCAVINLNTIIKGSTLSLGDRNLDSTIVDFIQQKYKASIGLNTAELLKEQIGSLYPNDSAQMEVNAVDINSNRPLLLSVSASDIYEATYMFLDEVVKIIKTTINTLSPEVSSDVVRNGVIVCGGYSKMIGIEKYLRQKLGINVYISDDSNNSTISGLYTLINQDDLLQNILLNL